MGTDNIGRDIFAQVLQGGRVSLAVGVTAMLLALFLGTLIGVLAGYFRRLDGPLMRLTDLFLALPLLPLLLVVIMLFRDTLRAAVRAGDRDLPADRLHHRHHQLDAHRAHRARRRAGAEGARVRAGGEVDRHAARRGSSPATSCRTCCRRSWSRRRSASPTPSSPRARCRFLGLGFPSDFPTWGRLLFDGANFMTLTPARVIWPGLAISLTVLSINFIGDGLRDALDPRIRGR